jgi:excisionase family DNA binding protein
MRPTGVNEAADAAKRSTVGRGQDADVRGAYGDRASVRPLLRDAEVAGILSVQPDTVRRWAARGELPCVRLGRLLRFRPADIDAWIGARVRPRPSHVSMRRRPGAIRGSA